MSVYAESLAALQHALLTRDASPALAWLDEGQPALGAKLAVYIDGYRVRLKAALKSDYPATAHALGEARFAAAATAYIEANPSRHFSLDPYPLPFAEFLAETDGFIRDLARLEAAIAEIFRLPDSPAFTQEGRPDVEWFAQWRPRLRTASRLMLFEYPVNAYLADFREEKLPGRPEPEAGYLFIVRHQNDVRRHALFYAEYAILHALSEGSQLADALAALDIDDSEIPALANALPEWVTRWLNQGFFQSN